MRAFWRSEFCRALRNAVSAATRARMVSMMSCVARSTSSQRISPNCSLKVRRMLESRSRSVSGGGRRPRWAPGRSRRPRPAAGSSASPASRSGSCPGRWRPGCPWTGPPPPACRIRCKRATDPILKGQPSGNKKPPVGGKKPIWGWFPQPRPEPAAAAGRLSLGAASRGPHHHRQMRLREELTGLRAGPSGVSARVAMRPRGGSGNSARRRLTAATSGNWRRQKAGTGDQRQLCAGTAGRTGANGTAEDPRRSPRSSLDADGLAATRVVLA